MTSIEINDVTRGWGGSEYAGYIWSHSHKRDAEAYLKYFVIDIHPRGACLCLCVCVCICAPGARTEPEAFHEMAHSREWEQDKVDDTTRNCMLSTALSLCTNTALCATATERPPSTHTRPALFAYTCTWLFQCNAFIIKNALCICF